MKDVNKLILVGRLGADPALRQTKNAVDVASFSLATHYRLVSNGVEAGTAPEQCTQWHRIIVWGKQATWCSQKLGRGDSVFIQGTLRSRSFEKEGGEKREVYEVYANDITLLKKASAKIAESDEIDEEKPEEEMEVEETTRPGHEFPLTGTQSEAQYH